MDSLKGGIVLRIIGTGSYLPDNIVENSELEDKLNLERGWIEKRTGIKERRFATDETPLELALRAAEEALKDSKKKPQIVIVHSSTIENGFPSIASMVSKELGLNPFLAYDVVSGCTGFLHTLISAISVMQNLKLDNVLMIATELLSKHIDFTDRDTAILFGDGAGALFVERDSSDEFILASDFGTDVKKAEDLTIDNMTGNVIRMNGREVFRFAVRTLGKSILKVLAAANITIDELDYFIPHQSNARIIASVNRELKIPEEKIISYISSYGNTASASIPIAIDKAAKEGKLKEGNRVLLSGYGAGLSWSSILIDWRNRKEDKSCILESVFQGYSE
ncbi:ketoacyl-ACP synthase III [Kosmotoga pacifica]|uniref:ketoacyl-ACP synthase III n=1 Tax=Kosmotoga pacifica TaxID=1330330 RepID=UPI00069CA701|nr:ketoacyl-ACP synthase III [Kosmotoga pacifica]